ncbi:hypothetical protein [Pseudomonas sp.]|uniref:hypothetical protein n=1 Tax=Pseudomonas sp. TaxID=306 RepID=UPI0032667CB6
MSQHDLTVDNGPGLTFRTDMNAALQALASQSSGASAPSPTFPCQMWADTGTGRLRQRNSANTAWVDRGALDVVSFLSLAGGTLSGAVNDAPIQTIASATLTDIGAATSNVVAINGTATIASLGSITAGARRTVCFLSSMVLTYNATSLILPGNANIATSVNDTAEFLSLGSGNWLCLDYTRAAILAAPDIQGFISGFKLNYVGRRAITINAGAAYIPSSKKTITSSADIALTGITFSAGLNHLYLYDNAGVSTIEVSAVVPEVYAGTAYRKTSDSTRRYLGSVLANASLDMYAFRHDPALSEVIYTEGTPGVAPFTLYSGFNSSTPTLADTAAVAPKQTATKVSAVSNGGIANFCVSEQLATPGGANWGMQSANGFIQFPVSRASATLGKYITWTNASTSLYCTGYTFER